MQDILEDFISIEEAAQQPNVPGPRTLRRMIARREIPVTYLGNKPLIYVPGFRAALLARMVKPVTER